MVQTSVVRVSGLAQRLTSVCSIGRDRWVCAALILDKVIYAVMMYGLDAIVEVHIHRHITVYYVKFIFNLTSVFMRAYCRGVVADTLESLNCRSIFIQQY